jgi:hypothetical protein
MDVWVRGVWVSFGADECVLVALVVVVVGEGAFFEGFPCMGEMPCYA